MFEVKEKVYYPTLNGDGKLYEVIDIPNPNVPILIIKDGFKSNRSDGKAGIITSDLFVFKANTHNRLHLSELYPNIEFVKPTE